MADPLSITVSVLALSTAAIQSANSLRETVKRYQGRDKTLRRLQHELGDLTEILETLARATGTEDTLLKLLEGPVERCTQICHDFEMSMEVFGNKTKAGFRDWARLEFMRGDINEFIESIAGYKSTISIGLGTITMLTSKVSQTVLEEYNELVQDTVYNLELRLQQIDEKMAQLTLENKTATPIKVDLGNEKDVTLQCLHVCEKARSYLHDVSVEASPLLRESSSSAGREQFYEAQMRIRQTLNESQDQFARTASHMSRRLESLTRGGDSNVDHERFRLQSDIEISKQCLAVCDYATEVSRQKIFRIGEVTADGDSDQVVVTTLADLFDIGKAVSKDNSAQLLGSMSAECLRDLTEKRYNSRFGSLNMTSHTDEVLVTGSRSNEFSKDQRAPSAATKEPPVSKTTPIKPSSNQTKKRTPDDNFDQ